VTSNLPANRLGFDDELPTERQIRASLHDWAVEVLGPQGLSPAAHHNYLLEELNSLSKGDFDRLMILMPPGSAKSTYASILFPAWWFTQHSNSTVIATSHSSVLAEHFSRRVRDMIKANDAVLGYSVDKAERAASRWRTTQGGEYVAAGIRGSVVGRRADLVIIDDPIKSAAEAESPTHRDFLWNWYRYDLTTRLKPKARIVLIMTRWHEADLGGRLLAIPGTDWRVLRLPALAEEGDPLGRRPGQPLWPEWEDEAALERKRQLIGERTWTALFQQSPRPAEGSLFRVACLTFLDQPPSSAGSKAVRAWDLAATVDNGSNDPDWTAGIKLVRDRDGRFTVVDVIRLRGSPRQIEETIISTARLDGHGVPIGLPEDPGQAGKSQISYLTSRLAGYRVIASRESGSKFTRALSLASQVEAGNVAILRADWNLVLVDELRDFPYGRKDDQVDALVRAFTTLLGVADTVRQTTVPFFNR
jgi:predicted phage terminase large subunit-like protein